jgi:hypothetical protein
VILRPGKTSSGVEVRKLLSRLIGRIRRHWPSTHITIRGDGHYGRDEAMTWCENASIDYIFGLAGNVVLDRLVEPTADMIHAHGGADIAVAMRLRRNLQAAAVPGDAVVGADHAILLDAPERKPLRGWPTSRNIRVKTSMPQTGRNFVDGWVSHLSTQARKEIARRGQRNKMVRDKRILRHATSAPRR